MSRPAGTFAWVTATEAIRVGAMNMPLRKSSAVTATGWVTNGSGSTEMASSRAPTRKRRGGEARQTTVPVTSPATSEPAAQTMTISPV